MTLACRHGCDPEFNPAWIVVWLSAGCVCFPRDRAQALCRHHSQRLEPLGEILREVLV